MSATTSVVPATTATEEIKIKFERHKDGDVISLSDRKYVVRHGTFHKVKGEETE